MFCVVNVFDGSMNNVAHVVQENNVDELNVLSIFNVFSLGCLSYYEVLLAYNM